MYDSEDDAEGEDFDTLDDGMDGELEEAAEYFEFDIEEVDQEGYSFRYDADYTNASSYDIKVCIASSTYVYSSLQFLFERSYLFCAIFSSFLV